jgi:glycosyltransferase involved in cell wall biosynthesis
LATKRKLLFYTHAMSGGGAERVWALLASRFAQRGHDVILAVDYDTNDNAGFVDPAVRRITLGGNHLTSSLRLARLMRTERPDISLSALSVSNLKHLAAALLSGRRRRAIQTYHGYDHSEPQPLSQISYRLTPLSSRLFARTVAVSDGLLTHILGKWRASRARSLRIYNPAAGGAPAHPAQALALADRPPVVLSGGRLVAYKNFPLLIRAFAQVEPKDARLVIMGEGAERAAIEAEVGRVGIEQRVTLAGYVRDPWALYEAARCFVLASNSESFGLVVAEALAHGLPVVATASDGPREILQDGVFGALVPHENEAALAAAITRALAAPGDPEPRRARARAFSVDAAADLYAALFEDVIARANPFPARES